MTLALILFLTQAQVDALKQHAVLNHGAIPIVRINSCHVEHALGEMDGGKSVNCAKEWR
jgi:hypothetical protein